MMYCKVVISDISYPFVSLNNQFFSSRYETFKNSTSQLCAQHLTVLYTVFVKSLTYYIIAWGRWRLCTERSCKPPGCTERSHMAGVWGVVEVNNQCTVEKGGRASGSRENKLQFEVGYLWLKWRKKIWVEKGTQCFRDPLSVQSVGWDILKFKWYAHWVLSQQHTSTKYEEISIRLESRDATRREWRWQQCPSVCPDSMSDVRCLVLFLCFF